MPQVFSSAKKRRKPAVIAIVVLFTVSAITIAAANPLPPKRLAEPVPTSCGGTALRDYLRPLRRLPRLHAPPVAGQLPFAPPGVVVATLPSLLIGGGAAGYQLTADPSTPGAQLDWRTTATLALVDRRGELVEVEARLTKDVGFLAPGQGAGLRFTLGAKPGLWRIVVVFHSSKGTKLGGFGFYVRVVAGRQDVVLGLDAASYRPGQRVRGRIENFGAEFVGYGYPYGIERRVGGQWGPAPVEIGPFLLPLFHAKPGEAGKVCTRFEIPHSLPPGRYRMVKMAGFRTPGLPRFVRLATEFAVVSAGP